MKKESKKTVSKVNTKKAESLNGFESYKQSLIEAAESYVARRLAAEGESINKAKKREIQAFNLARLNNQSFELLQKVGFVADDIKNLRLCFYSKALSHVVNIVNGLSNSNFESRNNCLGAALIDLKRAAGQALFTKKQLAFNCNNAGLTGGANPHACIVGLIAGLVRLGDYDSKIKVIRLKKESCELLQKMSITTPKFQNLSNGESVDIEDGESDYE